MKIRLDPADCQRYGVPEVIELDDRLGLREAAAVQKVTGLDPDALSKALATGDLESMAALLWLAIGRAAGKRPDWDTFDVSADFDVEDEDEDPGKGESTPETTSSSE